MAKRIILLSDGTGNTSSNVWRTNVWRLYESLDLTTPDQVAFYDDGVGTSAFKPLAMLGGTFGWGLKRNVLDLYKFLCRHYEPGISEIYAFGFSRGGFTARVVTGLIGHQGVVNFTSEAELDRNALAAYREYRRDRYRSIFRVEKPLRALRDAIVSIKNRAFGYKTFDATQKIEVPSIRFIGVWDSVAAYGFPVEEMTIRISRWLWPLELPDRKLGDKVKRACQALALDDERTTFHPLLWSEEGIAPPLPVDGQVFTKDERLSQVWFPGVHANVGGGYPEDALAHIPLLWMMREAKFSGLHFKSKTQTQVDAFERIEAVCDSDGRLYDSRQGLGGTYRYGPRKIAELGDRVLSARKKGDFIEIDLPKIHKSAFDRIGKANLYAPLGLPKLYAVVQDSKENGSALILANHSSATESPAEALTRAHSQEKVWNLIWWRRFVYFSTIAVGLYLALFPLFHPTEKSAEYSSGYRIISEIIRLVETFLREFCGIGLPRSRRARSTLLSPAAS